MYIFAPQTSLSKDNNCPVQEHCLVLNVYDRNTQNMLRHFCGLRRRYSRPLLALAPARHPASPLTPLAQHRAICFHPETKIPT
ncbi:hypothetical protein E2C01_018068 [Portunus trituberculatus]|uniref:Uncharacterized protein n=1 Tax=Portunus trituberculatus TaxID=210409 RepID=A0A5B7DVH1_PORTR|nr:hypothetical protein [Portunus trituberculatus]